MKHEKGCNFLDVKLHEILKEKREGRNIIIKFVKPVIFYRYKENASAFYPDTCRHRRCVFYFAVCKNKKKIQFSR